MEANVRQKHILRIAYLASICLLAFFGGFSFLGTRGSWFLALGILVLLKQFFAKQLRPSLPLFVTIAFSAMLFGFHTFYTSFGFAYLIIYAIMPAILFIVGNESSDSSAELIAILTAISLGHAAFIAGDLVFTLQNGGSIDSWSGITTFYNFWNHKYTPRTHVSIELTIVCGLCAALFLAPGKHSRWYLRVLTGLLLAGYIIFSSFLNVRSPIVVVPATLAIVAIYQLIKEPSRKKKMIGLSILGGAILLFVLFWVFVANNVLGLKDYLMKIPGFNRFISGGGGDEARENHYRIFIEHWLEYPFGGMFRANLLGYDDLGNLMYFHNGFLQVYTHGGFPLSFVALILLVLLVFQVLSIKRTQENGTCLTLAVSVIVSVFAICMIEPMIISGPFVCSYVFLAGGYLAGQLAKQKQKRPFLLFGLNDWGETRPPLFGNLLKIGLFLFLGVGCGLLVSFTGGNPFYAVVALILFVLGIALLDKGEQSVISWVKTGLAFLFASGVIFAEFWALPDPSLLFSIAKVAIGLFVYLFIRISIIQKSDPEDGYRALRNMMIGLSKDVSLSEENLVD